MNPFFTVAAGIAIGVLGVRTGRRRLSRTATATKTHDGAAALQRGAAKAGKETRKAAVSGLSAVEEGSGALRRRLEKTPAEPAPRTKTAKPRKHTRKASGASVTSAKNSDK